MTGGGGFLMTMGKVPDIDAGGVPESFKVTTTLYVPAVVGAGVGVPVISPFWEFMTSPGGSDEALQL